MGLTEHSIKHLLNEFLKNTKPCLALFCSSAEHDSKQVLGSGPFLTNLPPKRRVSPAILQMLSVLPSHNSMAAHMLSHPPRMSFPLCPPHKSLPVLQGSPSRISFPTPFHLTRVRVLLGVLFPLMSQDLFIQSSSLLD